MSDLVTKPDFLDPLHFDPGEWNRVSSSGLTDGMWQHEDSGEHIDDSYFEMLVDQSRAIDEADVVPIEQLRTLQFYFEKRTDDNKRKFDIADGGPHGGISVGRKRSAQDLRDLLDEHEGPE